MKLVDILARELKVWPEGVAAISQGGMTHALYDSSFQCIEPEIIVSPADDRGKPGVMQDSVYVTRDQWQAAVDALRVEARPVESMALHHQEVGRITRQWAGKGLPPVGTVCEMSIGDPVEAEWFVGTVVAHIDLDRPVAVAHNGEDVFHGYAEDFRPIRTPEQIAADERYRCVQRMAKELKESDSKHGSLYALYDLGYRKFEIVDN